MEDAFGALELACPECQQRLQVPSAAGQRLQQRTSALALGSLILAVMGAFTVVGSAVAVILGLAAIVVILCRRERITGFGFAVSGVVIGVEAQDRLNIAMFHHGDVDGVTGGE